jgi:cytoskeleton protein RodZ
MKSLGEYLRNERLSRGISLEQISRETRISMRMLQAIEDGNTETLPAAVLVKSFLRAYAQMIGLDPEVVVLRYQDLHEEEGARKEALEKFRERFRPVPSARKLIVPGVAAVLVACLIAAWLLFPGKKHELAPSSNAPTVATTPREAPPVPSSPPQAPAPSTVQPPSPSVKPTPPAIPPPMRETVLPSEQPSLPAPQPAGERPSEAAAGTPLGQHPFSAAVPTPQSPPAPPPKAQAVPPVQPSPAAPSLHSEYVLKGEAVETTWVRISIDRGRQVEYLLQPGEQVSWQAKSGFSLLVGNAGGLRLFLNDKPLKALGQKGQVVSVSLPDNSLLQTPAAAPSARPATHDQ